MALLKPCRYYTDKDWGAPDKKAFWGEYVPHASTIDFYVEPPEAVWGADDDTDIEYMYLSLMLEHNTSKLSPKQIRDGWLKHTYSETDAPFFKKFPESEPARENFLWASNEHARILMEQGILPPETGLPANNPFFSMIDAQLTTEVFGLLAPGQPDVALDIARLPIRTTASAEAASIAEFYVVMHALAPVVDKSMPINEQVMWLADSARAYLTDGSYPAAMYDFVKNLMRSNPDINDWESTRDEVYKRFQLKQKDGYAYSEPFDAGINFAASLISLFYGQGDFVRTIKIGSLVGWDSDNPTATWGGLLGFMIGKQGILDALNLKGASDTYWIHRTRRNFVDHMPEDDGENTFTNMAQQMLTIVERDAEVLINGKVSPDAWFIKPTR